MNMIGCCPFLYMSIKVGEHITFPLVVNCKSPYYFNTAFNPILVTGDDGNDYNVIPSGQFK